MTAEIGLALRPAEAVALRADSCISPDAAGDSWHSRDPSPGRRGPGPVTEPHASPAASNTGRTALSEQYRSPRSLPVSCAGTCTLSGAPKMGGCSGVPAAARSARASTAGSGTRPAPQPCRRTGQAPSRCAAPTICAIPHCRGDWPPAPRPPRSRPAPAQRARPAHHLRPRHTRLRPDRQPAHRASPPPQPLAPRWPTKSAQTPGIRSVMRPCHSWTQRDTAAPETSVQIRYTPVSCGNADQGDQFYGSLPGRAIPGAPVS
jgi:hypothetical protein